MARWEVEERDEKFYVYCVDVEGRRLAGENGRRCVYDKKALAVEAARRMNKMWGDPNEQED